MTVTVVGENAKIDIGKPLGIKVKSFVTEDAGPGTFAMTGKKLIFTTPEMGINDDYDTSVTITYLNKKGREITKDFNFIVGDSDNTTTYYVGDAGANAEQPATSITMRTA